MDNVKPNRRGVGKGDDNLEQEYGSKKDEDWRLHQCGRARRLMSRIIKFAVFEGLQDPFSYPPHYRDKGKACNRSH